jgi:hypothetical protein
MPEPGGSPVEQLLLKFGLDLSPVKAAAGEIKASLQALNNLSDQLVAKGTQAGVSQKAILEQLKAAAQAATIVSKQATTQEGVKTTVLKTQTEELRKQIMEQRLMAETTKSGVAAEQVKKAALAAETAEIQKHILERKAETAEIQRQIVELRRKRLADQPGAGAAERAVGAGLMGRVGQALTGGGLAGGIAGGLLAGGGIAAVLMIAGDMLVRFITRVREATIESGKLVEVYARFEQVARGKDVDPSEMMSKLTEATEGLVPKLVLAQVATKALQSQLKITPDRIAEVSGAMVKLAESSGHSATQAMNMLGMAMSRGGARAGYMLSRVTGLTPELLRLAQTPQGLNRTEQSIAGLTHAFNVLIREADKLKDIPENLEQVQERAHLTFKGLFTSFAKGFNESGGTQAFMKLLSDDLMELRKSGGAFEQFGQKVGNVMLLASTALESFKVALLGLVDVANSVGDALKAAFGMPAESATGTLATIRAIGTFLLDVSGMLKILMTMMTSVVKVAGALLAPIGDLSQYLVSLTVAMSNIGNPTKFKAGMEEASRWAKKMWEDLTTEGGKKIMEAMFTDVDKAGSEAADAILKFQSRIDAASQAAYLASRRRATAEVTSSVTEEPDIRHEMRMAQLRLRRQQALAQLALQERQNELQLLRQADLDAYEEGEEDLAQHVERQRQIAFEGFTARVDELTQMHKSKLEEMKEEFTTKVASPARDEGEKEEDYALRLEAYGNAKVKATKEYNTKVETENLLFHKQVLAAEKSYQQEDKGIIDQGEKDRRQARVKGLQDALTEREKERQLEIQETQRHIQQQQDAVTAAAQARQRKLQKGEITPGVFAQEEIAAIESFARAQLEAEQQQAALKITAQEDIRKTAELEAAAMANNLTARENARHKIADSLATERGLREALADRSVRLVQQAEDKITAIIDGQVERRLQSIQKQYQLQQQALEEQIQYQQVNPAEAGGFTVSTSELLESLTANLEQQRKAFEELIQEAEPYSDQWYQIFDRIEKAYQAQVKYNLELSKMQDILRPAANLFGQLGQQITQVFKSAFAENLGQVIQQSARQMEQMPLRKRTIQAAFGIESGMPQKDPVMIKLEQEAAGLFQAVRKSTDPLNVALTSVIEGLMRLAGVLDTVATGGNTEQAMSAAASSASSGRMINLLRGTFGRGGASGGQKEMSGTEKMDKFVTGIIAATGAVMDFVATLTASKSAITGAIGGAMSGASMGSMFGPWGALAGAVGGAVTGGIVGGKNAAVTRNVHQMQQQFKDLMQDFSMNANNLQQTITQIEQMIVQVQGMQSSSKKGSSQYQQLIDQYVDQLKQLQVQQHAIIVDLGQQLAILSAPQQMQDYLSTIESVIKEFQKYVGAARPASEAGTALMEVNGQMVSVSKDLADAYDFLNKSIEKYQYNLEVEGAQANEQAINDAIQLNDLLLQRQQAYLALNKQIEGVLTQGVMSRLPTRAQQAGAQIYEIQLNAQVQMEKLNEQIQAAQYRVSSESKIFDMATTRIGLENQLLALQNQQTDRDMARIVALTQLINAMQSGDWSAFGPIADLIAALPGVTNTGAGGVEGTIGAAYQDRASLGYALFRGQNL